MSETTQAKYENALRQALINREHHIALIEQLLDLAEQWERRHPDIGHCAGCAMARVCADELRAALAGPDSG